VLSSSFFAPQQDDYTTNWQVSLLPNTLLFQGDNLQAAALNPSKQVRVNVYHSGLFTRKFPYA